MPTDAGSYYPPVGFYFRVAVSGFRGKHDASFQEVSGLTAERDVEEIEEGGENRFKHRLPKRAKFSNLVLKRGLVTKGSGLASWCRSALESDLNKPIKPHDLDVQLLDADGKPLMKWSVVRAWPVKWSVSDFKSQENQLVIETLEFAYSYFTAK